MLTLRPSDERGRGDHGWLRSRHTFSFANYIDPRHRGFRNLRVINEDLVAGDSGFPMHDHANMEIFSYAVRGHLAHQDSQGNKATIGPGDVQFMSAGSGIMHSEFNASPTDEAHFLQIWIFPSERGGEPRYEDRSFQKELASGRPVRLLDPKGTDGAIRIGADAVIWGARMPRGASHQHDLASGRGAWIQIIKGEITVNGQPLAAGDGLAAEDEASLAIHVDDDAEFLLFDLGN